MISPNCLPKFLGFSLAVCSALVCCAPAYSVRAAVGDQLHAVSISDDKELADNGLAIAGNDNIFFMGARGDYLGGIGGPAGYKPGGVVALSVETGEELYTLRSPADSGTGSFGAAVAIYDNQVLVGSRAEQAGAIHFYDLTTGDYQSTLLPEDDTTRVFGSYMKVAGTKLAVRTFDSVHLIDLETGAELYSLHTPFFDRDKVFTEVVALNEDYLIVGEVEGESVGRKSGAAHVYDVHTGEKLWELSPSDAKPYQLFGSSVAIEGDRALIGAYGDEAAQPGAAYLFDLTTGQEIRKLMSPTHSEVSDKNYYDRFGYRVAMRGELAVVSAVSDFESVPAAGALYLYDTTNGKLLHKFLAEDAQSYDHMGASIVLGEDVIVASSGSDGPRDKNRVLVFSLVPEPATSSLLALACLALLSHRRPKPHH